jgi:uncharacterized membrane protein
MIPEMNRIVSLDARAVDWAHIHILLNHFPVILAITGMLAVLLAMLRGQRAIWIYGAVSLTLAAITVIPTYFTGEPAEHALNRPWYIARGVIHTHEDASKIASLLVLLAGLVAAVAWRRLVRYPREVRMPGSLRTALIVTALAAAGAIGYSSWLGGRIVHDSPVLLGPPPAGFVRPGAPPPATPAPMTPAPATPAPMSPVP